jgi:hypothetical protein
LVAVTPGESFKSAGRGIACLSRFDHGKRAWNPTSKIRVREDAGAANLSERSGCKSRSGPRGRWCKSSTAETLARMQPVGSQSNLKCVSLEDSSGTTGIDLPNQTGAGKQRQSAAGQRGKTRTGNLSPCLRRERLAVRGWTPTRIKTACYPVEDSRQVPSPTSIQ